MDQHIGTQLGNYRIVEDIGRGSYGIVYRAEHVHLGHSVAIKFIHAYLNTPQQQTSFRQEGQTLIKLRHPQIVRLLDFGTDEGIPYLISEYAPGGSLREYLGHQASLPLPVRNAQHMLAQVGRALAYVHSQGIIHRDLKPENILFDRDGKALLADFGIAKVKRTTGASGADSASSLMGLGTPPYMAPEQFKPKGEPLPESDQYALGCIAYELLTGQLPFTADNIGAYGFQHVYESPPPLRQLIPTLPPRIEQAVLTALAKNPAERHATVEAFLVALGIPRLAPTQVSLTSNPRQTTRDAGMGSFDDSTVIKQSGQTLTEGEITTARSPQHLVSTEQFTPTILRATAPVQPTSIAPRTQPASVPSQTMGSPKHTLPPTTPTRTPPTRQVSSLWKRVQTITAGASALVVAKWLFLLAALIDLPLLLSGFWLGPSFLLQAGTILAVSICICGLALNFFTKPWIWLVVFLLFSPLSSGLYMLAVIVFKFDLGIIDWHIYCSCFLLTPAAGILYGLFGPTRHREETIVPSFTKRLTLTIWFLGAGLFVVGFGAPVVTYIGLAWAVAAGILAAAQLIRLKKWEWLGVMAFSSAMALGVPILFWGFAYGAFGPTTEE